MAKSPLLNTSTATFLDLMGTGRSFQVANCQPDYAWSTEQWDDLWEDLSHLHQHPDARHFMGAVVLTGVEDQPDRRFWIIDGQQRFVTLSILTLSVIRRLRELADQGVDTTDNHTRAQSLRDRFLGEKDPVSLVEASKLQLNETDDPFYQDHLIRLRAPTSLRAHPRSCQLLWHCLEWFGQRLAQADFGEDGESLTRLITESAARQLLFIRIEVDDELRAFTVFETLNARGLGLSPTDLIKNYLFSLVRQKPDLRSLQRRWKRLIETVRQQDFPEFLRYHLLCSRPRVRSRNLFKILKQDVAEAEDVFALLDELEARADLFAALHDSEHELWIEYPSCRQFVRELLTFRVKQMTPLLFAAWERLPDRFDQILQLVSVLSFRYSVVGKRNSSDLEPAYHAAARAILDGTSKSARDVFQSLEPLYVDDSSFCADFAGFEIRARGPGKKLARYVLAKLESRLSGKSCDPSTDPFTIEHVLPENPGPEWFDEFPEARVSTFVDRIGNMLPLDAASNRALGNLDFAAKLETYAASRYASALDVAEHRPPTWNPKALEQRQSRLAKIAVQAWRLDFD